MEEVSGPNFSFQTTQAGESYTKEGKDISKGKETQRLQVVGAVDNRIAIASKQVSDKPQSTVSRFLDAIRYVKVSVSKDEKIAINYGSLKRIGISRSEANHAARQGTLPQLIHTRSLETHAKLQEMDKTTEDIAAKFDKVGEKEKLVTRGDENASAGLNKAQLQKVTWLAINSSRQGAQIVRAGKARVLVQHAAAGQFHLTPLRHVEHLGAGTYGEVSKVVDITNAGVAAMKMASVDIYDPKHSVRAERDTKNEAARLLFLNRNGPKRGIQAAPVHQAFSIANPQITAYVGVYYDRGDLDNALKHGVFKTPDQRLDAVHQLFCGSRYCEDENIGLGDIKPGNILVRTDPTDNTKLEVVLSDLGGSQVLDVNNVPKDPKKVIGTRTTAYLLEKDRTAIKLAAQQATPEKYRQYQHARDVFALGATTFQILAGRRPYGVTENGHPNIADLEKTLAREDVKEALKPYGPDIADFFRSVMNPDIDKRPSPTQALEQLEALIELKRLADQTKSSQGISQ